MEEKDLAHNDTVSRSFRGWLLRPYRLAVLALVAGHFVFLMSYFEPAISTPDANGYFAQAQLIVNHGRTWFEPESPLQYVGVHWLKTESNRHYSRYPLGLPAILAAAFKLGGPKAALLVNPVLTSLTLLGLFMLCGLWIGEGWGLAAAAAMALNPVANTFALAGDSHAATAFFLVWGLYLLARWARTLSPLTAFFAGLCLGVIPTIRYAEVLFGLAVGLFMVMHRYYGPRVLKSLVAAAIGALIPVSCLMIRNQMAFSAFWKTGYSLTNEQTGFSFSYFLQNAVPYLQNIQGEGAGLFAALGLVGIAAISVRRETRRQGILLLGLVLPITLLYMAYYFAPAQMAPATMRFLLPTFFMYAIGGVWCLKIIAESRPRGAYAAAIAVLVVTAVWGLPQSILHLTLSKYRNAALASITRIVTEHVEPGAILIADPQIQQHLDFIGRWRLADQSVFQGRTRMPGFDRLMADPDTPSPIPQSKLAEKRKTLERYRNTGADGLSDKFLDDLDSWALPEWEVYWIGSLEEIEELVPPGDSLNLVARIELPRLDMDKLGLSKRFPGMPKAAMPGGRQGLRSMPRPLMPVGGNIQRRLMHFFADGKELTLVQWSRPLEKVSSK